MVSQLPLRQTAASQNRKGIFWLEHCQWRCSPGHLKHVKWTWAIYSHAVRLCDWSKNCEICGWLNTCNQVTTGRKNLKSDSMQRATDQRAKWSKENKLGINATKTTEILISLGHDISLPFIELNGWFIERVNKSKLLGDIISSDLKWDAHVHYINSISHKEDSLSQRT